MTHDLDEPRPSRKIWPQILLSVLVLLIGVGGAAALILSRTPPERRPTPALGPLVEAVQVTPGTFPIAVEGQGEVGARTRVEVLPEVSGRVIEVHPNLVTGGRLRAGETLVTLDPRDYELAVESARASIAGAETLIEQEQAEAEAALAEWRAVHGDAEPPKLLVREPQVRRLEAERAAAEAQLASARLNLERTRIRLPFDAIVQRESVDRGQFLNQGRAVATVYGTDAVEIRVPLDDAELRWFDLPRGAGSGPKATVSAEFAGQRRSWPGRVERLEGEVDPRTRQVHLVVRVDDPFDGDGPPLLPGTFVDVEIEGRALENVLKIPRHALRPGDVVWTVKDGALKIR
ncbi:MAG: efflux RND transporter periplasmic adaptor subunit, partial [Acidobacteriota bacterium]